jgi:hypothetical protein
MGESETHSRLITGIINDGKKYSLKKACKIKLGKNIGLILEPEFSWNFFVL